VKQVVRLVEYYLEDEHLDKVLARSWSPGLKRFTRPGYIRITEMSGWRLRLLRLFRLVE
jgi:hypothetical protein